MSSAYFIVISRLSSTSSYFIILFVYISLFYLIVIPERGTVLCFGVFLFVFASTAAPSRPILRCCSHSCFCCYIMNCAQYGFKFHYLCLVDLDLLEVEV